MLWLDLIVTLSQILIKLCVQSLAAPLDDSRLQKEFYTRTYEQNEELGLNDMKTENYESLNVITEEEEKNETES